MKHPPRQAREEIIGFLYEKENEVSQVASRLLAARVLSEGASVVQHDAAIEWAIQGAIGIVGGVRDEIAAFAVFLSAEKAGLYPDNPRDN
jgi:hypothetical protein